MNKNSGFTLIETTITIVILSIIGYNTLPKLLQFENFTESLFYHKLHHNLSYAQSRSIYSGCHVAIMLLPRSINFRLRDNCQSGPFNKPLQFHDDSINKAIIELPKNLAINSENFPIYFDDNGQARSIQNNIITNASININGNSIDKTITITGYNGLIE